MVLDGDGYPYGWRGGDGIRYKPIGAGTGKKIIPAAGMGMGMGIDFPDEDGDGKANTRPAPFASLSMFVSTSHSIDDTTVSEEAHLF